MRSTASRVKRMELARLLEAGPLDDAVDPGREAGADEAAVAPRGAPRHPARLQHDHALAALDQAQRRRQPRQAAADDAHVGLDLAVERWPCGAGLAVRA